MKTIIQLILIVGLFQATAQAQSSERNMRNFEDEMKELKWEMEQFHSAEMETALHDLELKIQRTQPEIDSLVAIKMADLPEALEAIKIDLSALENLRVEVPDIPEIHVEIPSIPDMNIEIPPIPEINIDLSELEYVLENGDHVVAYQHDNHQFRKLSDDERIQVQAIRSLGEMEPQQALPTLIDLANNDTNPAFRYEAVNQLRHFTDESDAVSALINAAQKDKNVHVRKKAISILGTCNDDRARQALHELISRQLR